MLLQSQVQWLWWDEWIAVFHEPVESCRSQVQKLKTLSVPSTYCHQFERQDLWQFLQHRYVYQQLSKLSLLIHVTREGGMFRQNWNSNDVATSWKSNICPRSLKLVKLNLMFVSVLVTVIVTSLASATSHLLSSDRGGYRTDFWLDMWQSIL